MARNMGREIDDWFEKKHTERCQCEECRNKRMERVLKGEGEPERRWGDGARDWDSPESA